MVNFNYDVSEITPTGSYDPLPSNWYVAQVTSAEAKTPKSGRGEMLCVTFEIIDGEFRGRKVWGNYCHVHPTPKAQEIARQHISAISHAVGLPKCSNSDHWYQLPLKIKVKLKRDKESDEMVNEIVGYASVERIAPTPKAAPNPSAGKQAEGGTPPWMRELPESAQ